MSSRWAQFEREFAGILPADRLASGAG